MGMDGSALRQMLTETLADIGSAARRPQRKPNIRTVSGGSEVIAPQNQPSPFQRLKQTMPEALGLFLSDGAEGRPEECSSCKVKDSNTVRHASLEMLLEAERLLGDV
ncbi:hypothetical protein EYF80_029501 [Liparis tanakae]|uniref:Uncharacterized protein n=1 Tax=Liparis tanakae TaxID=230148 RepID=A0A4Z2H310_9TELE|nr:hypothetical protein EYF80_029501 [Liparis tanakae]